MRKLIVFIITLFVVTITVKAQPQQVSAGRDEIMKDGKMPHFPDWDPNPKMHPVPPEYNNEHAIVLLESEKIDYKFEGTGITMYSTIHRIIKVLDRLGIESFNTVLVPFRNGETRVDSVKARTILPDGTTRNVKYEMLYVGGGEFLFALDGMEKNAEVEIVIKYKSISSYFGSRRYQYGIPVLNAYFELNYPKELTINTKGYHGFPSGNEEMVGGHKQVKIFQANIPKLESQPFSFYDLYGMRIEFGIDHFTHRGGYERSDNYTWDMYAHSIYQRYYNFRQSEKNAAARFLTTIGIRGGETELEKIKKIEEGIKTNIVAYWEISGRTVDYIDSTPEAKYADKYWETSKVAENIDSIVLKKSASERGIIRLFCACLKVAGVKHELGITSNRTEHLMDNKFVNWQPLQDYLFYFPDFDAYLAPTEPFYRYPEVPYEMINNKGLFCKTNPESEFNIGREITESEAIIRTISPLPANYTQVNGKININLDKDFGTVVETKRTYSGYSAPELRKEIAAASPEEKKKLILKESILADKPEMLLKYSIDNESISAVYENKPLIINTTVRTSDLVEKAGAGYLLKIGEVIGTQPNFYSKEERVLPVDIEFPHTNHVTISVTIPEGYKAQNLEALKIYAEVGDKNTGVFSAYFKSDYQLTGNNLVVTITRSYPQLHYSVSEFESFKKVMNAAADFNKVSILIEAEKGKGGKKSKPHAVAANKSVKK